MREKLLDIIEEICNDDAVRENIDADLFEEGFFDSLAVVELIVAISNEFNVTLAPTEYDKEDFSTIRKIEKILTQKGIK